MAHINRKIDGEIDPYSRHKPLSRLCQINRELTLLSLTVAGMVTVSVLGALGQISPQVLAISMTSLGGGFIALKLIHLCKEKTQGTKAATLLTLLGIAAIVIGALAIKNKISPDIAKWSFVGISGGMLVIGPMQCISRRHILINRKHDMRWAGTLPG